MLETKGDITFYKSEEEHKEICSNVFPLWLSISIALLAFIFILVSAHMATQMQIPNY